VGRSRRQPDATADTTAAGLLRAARDLLARQRALEAYDLLVRGRARGDAPALAQQQALALCELGDPEGALGVLEPLRRRRGADVETLGIAARAWKDLALRTPRGVARTRALARAQAAYLDGWRRTGAYWHAVNAATLAHVAGRRDEARRLARATLRLCQRLEREGAPASERYWLLATQGEALLLLGRTEEALEQYRRAAPLARAQWRNLKSARRNARLVLEHAGTARFEAEWPLLQRALPIPSVGVCVGHMLDRAGRRSPRFPARNAAAVRRAIARWVRERGVGFGVVSAAAGTDLLFAEVLRETGGSTDLLLPYPADEFAKDSVAYAGRSWTARFRAVLAGARRVAVASLHPFDAHSASYEYGAAYLEGMARLRAEELGVPLERLAVWDGRRGDGPGGTAHTVAAWARDGVAFDVIDPRAPARGAAPCAARPPARPRASGRRGDRRVVTALFADAVGFSQLSEAQVERFVQRFLGRVARAIRPYRTEVSLCETWGDDIFVVVPDAAVAGRLALAVARCVRERHWERDGLPARMALRIGLHAGPVRWGRDPLTGRPGAFGTHLSHAARIEPITPPGRVYASEAYAALLAAAGVRDLVASYVGLMPWAKGYATLPTYALRGARSRT